MEKWERKRPGRGRQPYVLQYMTHDTITVYKWLHFDDHQSKSDDFLKSLCRASEYTQNCIHTE